MSRILCGVCRQKHRRGAAGCGASLKEGELPDPCMADTGPFHHSTLSTMRTRGREAKRHGATLSRDWTRRVTTTIICFDENCGLGSIRWFALVHHACCDVSAERW
jgi:hypothetical protein